MPKSSQQSGRARKSNKQARATLRPTSAPRSSGSKQATIVAGTTMEAPVATGIAAISPEREYAFIREDMRRLLITAAILIAVMIGLLFVID